MWRTLRLPADGMLTPNEAERVHEIALRILAEVGLRVSHEPLRESLARQGLDVRQERVYFEPRLVGRYIEEHRRRLLSAPASPPESDPGLTLSVSGYNHDLEDPEHGSIAPFTTARLIEMTRFVDSLADRGVVGSTPGYPGDVPPELQPLSQYRIGAVYSRRGGSFGDISSPWVMECVMAMAEAMGSPVRGLPVYLVSPLHLGGDSLAIALHFRDRIRHLHVSGMPAAGATAPIEPFGALALAAAEAIGSYVALAMGTGLEVSFSVWVFPFDLRATTMVFGSPENLLLRALARDLNRFYGHRLTTDQGLGDIYVMAKEAGIQAAAEKASLMTAAALMGQRSFSGAGSLSMDDIFSPLQLLIDCEVRDHVQRLILGLPVEEGDTDWVALVREGVTRGFIAQDSTLDNHRRLLWYPRVFDRCALGAWLRAGSPRLLDRVRELYRAQLAAATYELQDGDQRRELDHIWEYACRRLVS